MSADRASRFALLALLLLFAGGAVVAGLRLVDGGPSLDGRGGQVGVLRVEGPILSGDDLLEDLEWLRSRRSVKGLVVQIESPGGAVGASQSLHAALERFREGTDTDDTEDRPVVAWIGDMGASGGYYVAAAADSIFALPGSITGSIGVIMQFPNAGELLRKVGVELEVVKSGEFKDIGSPSRSLSEEDREVLRTMVDDVYTQFVDVVTESRALDRDSVVRLADGRVYSGRQAVESGLVDRTATMHEAVEAAGRMAGLGARPDTLHPPVEKFTLFDLLTGVSTERVGSWLGWMPEWLPGPGASAPRLLYQWRPAP